ncbi:MAG: universal stress protein [Thermogemmatispora sp.]|uniref:universal stress protein n=1 Tax=Thermogemmatispora sp. TaxID=1968838 RepID=UPI0019EEC68A|nr:universal stress protein [Thermogemmatispora sp.]MBE3567348.1 universal stress protein [Thermogemmatispora sp.]
MFQRIFVPLDGSRRAEQAIGIAAHLAAAAHGSVLLFQTVDLQPERWPVFFRSQQVLEAATFTAVAQAQAYLEQQARDPALTGLPVEARARAGKAASTILREIEATQADLLVLACHGPNPWAVGSVTAQLIRHAPVPLLIWREDSPSLSQADMQTRRRWRLLAPLDGSLWARAALEPAVALMQALATQAEISVHLLRVVVPLPVQGEQEGARWLLRQRLRQAEESLSQAGKELERLWRRSAATVRPPALTWSVAVDPDVVHAIGQVAHPDEPFPGRDGTGTPDLLLLSAWGSNEADQRRLGSVAERLLQLVSLPILLVPTRALIQILHGAAQAPPQMGQ